MSSHLCDSLHGCKPVHDRGGIGGCHQKIKIPHRFHPPTKTTGRFHSLDFGQSFQSGQNLFHHGTGIPPEMTGGISFAVFNSGKYLLLRLFPKPLEFRNLSFLTGNGQGFNGINIQFLMKDFYLFPAETWNIEQIHQPGRHGCHQFIIKFELTRGVEGFNLFGECLTDARNISQTPRFNHLTQVFLHGLQSTGTCGIRPNLKWVLPFYLHHRTDAFQNLHDVLLIHIW